MVTVAPPNSSTPAPPLAGGRFHPNRDWSGWPAGPAELPARSPLGEREKFGRVLMGALAMRSGEQFEVSASPSALVTTTVTPLRLWQLVAGMRSGGTSVTVSRALLEDTYPAMCALASALDEAGFNGVWAAEDERTFRLGKARHIFVSVDHPGGNGPDQASRRPTSLLEVVGIDRIDDRWLHSRVAPRAHRPDLAIVAYSSRTPRAGGSSDTPVARLFSACGKSPARRFSLAA